MEFKKSGKRRNVRRRVETSSDEDKETSVVRGDKRCEPTNPLKSASCAFKKAKSEQEKVPAGIISTKSAAPEGPIDGGATKTIEIETATECDATAVYKRNLEASKTDDRSEEYKEVYKGAGGYQQFYEIRDTVVANAGGGQLKQGPIRRPEHLRATVRWDYAPDICKDYKETGYCGFGDSCKFMHDRSDYKSGWQLEREWQAQEYGANDKVNYEISDSDEELPFACYICRATFTSPIVTKCKHYFCEKCAIAHYKKTKKCFVCEKNTGGIFNPAKDIIEKMKKSEQET